MIKICKLYAELYELICTSTIQLFEAFDEGLMGFPFDQTLFTTTNGANKEN